MSKIKFRFREEMLQLLREGFNYPMSPIKESVRQFLYANRFIRTRDFAGNFHRGADIYYREMFPDLFFVFCSNHLSADGDIEQFDFWVVASDTETDFFHTLLRTPPRSVASRFTLPDNIPLLENELRKVCVLFNL